jgi:hypothetical protein
MKMLVSAIVQLEDSPTEKPSTYPERTPYDGRPEISDVQFRAGKANPNLSSRAIGAGTTIFGQTPTRADSKD